MVETSSGERWSFATELTPVRSSMIHAMRYDGRARLLEIVFKNGRTYQFVNVPPEEYARFQSAGSKGRYFQQNIRGVYSYWRFHRVRRSLP